MQDVDKLLLIASSVRGLVVVGEDVMEDGVLDYKDLQHAPKLFPIALDIIKAVKAYEEVLEEGKDVDPVEAVQLVNALMGRK